MRMRGSSPACMRCSATWQTQGRFKMAWEDNEDEYEDFYNFDAVPIEEAEAGVIDMT